MSIRIQRIEAQIQQLKILPHLQLITCQPDDLIRNDIWIIWLNGQKGSLYQNGKYPVRITFPDKYPLQPPKVQFQKDFLHVHVYEGGLICLPLLEQINWKSKVPMSQVIRRIDSLIHQDINPYSPANMTVFQMYKNNQHNRQKSIKKKQYLIFQSLAYIFRFQKNLTNEHKQLILLHVYLPFHSDIHLPFNFDFDLPFDFDFFDFQIFDFYCQKFENCMITLYYYLLYDNLDNYLKKQQKKRNMSKIKSQYLQRYRLIRPQKKGRLPQFTQNIQNYTQRTLQQIKGKVHYQLQTNKYGTKHKKQKQKQNIYQQLMKRQRNKTQRVSQDIQIVTRKISRLICQGIIPNLKYNQTKIDPQKKQKSLSNKRKQRQKSAVSRFNRQQLINESLKLQKLNQNTNSIHQSIKNVSTMTINLPNVPKQSQNFLPHLKIKSRKCIGAHQNDKQNYSVLFDGKIKYEKKTVYNKIHHIITMGRNQCSMLQKQRAIPYTTRVS